MDDPRDKPVVRWSCSCGASVSSADVGPEWLAKHADHRGPHMADVEHR